MFVITNPAIDPKLGLMPSIIGGSGALEAILSTVVTLVLIVSGVVAFLLLLYGGFEYITAGGDKEATQKASKRLTSALIGLTIVFSTFAIISLIEQIFGVSLIKFTIPTIT